MIRRTAALILALTLNPAPLYAQTAVITVSVPSAEVHKGPSTVTPVVGHAARGTVLPISRNLGSWVKIAWPGAPDGVGYLHVTMGRIGTSSASAPAASAPAATVPPRVASTPAPTTTTQTMPPPVRPSMPARQPVAPQRSIATPASHRFGIGGLVEPSSGFGATARAWRDTHLGVQVALSRDAMTSDVSADRVTSTTFEPGVVCALFDRVSDYIWIRPYLGSVVSIRHQTLSTAPLAPASDTGLGFRIFGGSELMFASLPQFGLSADLGYRRWPTPFAGFEAKPLSVSIAGHWYIK